MLGIYHVCICVLYACIISRLIQTTSIHVLLAMSLSGPCSVTSDGGRRGGRDEG